MDNIRFFISLIFAKIAYFVLKTTKLSGGTAIIGFFVLKICPNFLSHVNNYITNSRINVSGTNGKTTTTGIVSHLIKKSNHSFINNALGANMLNGIVNAISVELNPFKKYEFSVIETDEAFLKIVYDKLDAEYLLITNLFEDQTDRFESPLFTKSLIQEAVNKKPNIQLILNADEPVSASLVAEKPPIFYGINNVYDENNNLLENSIQTFKCPLCDSDMDYSKAFYSHLGHYDCKCGYSHPKSKYLADVILYENYSVLKLNNEEFKIPLKGLYNAYNALGAIALAKELNIDNIQENLTTFKVAFGRSEKRKLLDKDVLIQLIKNPAGTNEVLKTVDLNSNILIVMNNNVADGTDISWINQTNFELLANSQHEIVVSGLCNKEVEERLTLAGIKKIKVIPDIKNAVDYIGKNSDESITILTTYTALLIIDKIKEMKKCF